MLIIKGNSLEDLELLKNVIMVIKDGKIKYIDKTKFRFKETEIEKINNGKDI